MGGTTDNEGKVEMCTDGRWMAICSNGWTEQDAGQMCQKFGFASIGRFMIIGLFHLSLLFCAGAEVLIFNPRRVPTINCTISDSGDLSCNESCDDDTTDLGIRCVRQEVLNQVTNSTDFSCDYCNATVSPSVSHVQGNAMSTDTVSSMESSCGTESSTTALGVIVGLLVALLVVLLIVCGAMWNRISQKHKQM